ncbi:MAG: MiaB/RimO family radical SAM methylthiotransferase, partial [Kiritimatiellota bacterium]|nr:MiaB/RimO family radical SAM methylthiotransferase [Kiritimatiellota bacterium]
ELLRKVPGLDFAVGTHVLARVPAILAAVLPGVVPTSRRVGTKPGRRPILDVAPADDPYDGHTHLPGEISAFVNILFGCDRHCAYCVVPEVRGGEWSRPARDVIAEVRQLVAHGVKEVTLLGQSIMAYGRQTSVWDAENRSPRGFTEPLPRLLEALNDIPGLGRLRFTSGHPCGCSVEVARAFAELPAVCEHLHLPLQSASDRILKLMNRGYTAGDYRAAVRRLQAAAPRIVLSTDVIVGFPTETPEEFDLTRAFLEEIGFDNVYIFKYNPRPGTPAAQWSDDVSAKEKLRRNHALLEDQGRRSQAFHQAFVGQACEVLVEGPSLRNEARWAGRTRHNILAVFEALPLLKAGDLVMMRIAQATAQTLYGNVE